MRFVIRNLVDVEDPPRQRRQKFLLMSASATSVFPQIGRDDYGTPAQRKPERPVFQPRDRDEVFWNTSLLSIDQTSSLLQSVWVQGVTSAWQHYACHGCSMQAAEQHEAAE